MFWFVLTHLAAFFIDLAIAGRRSNRDQALEIVLLRQQVRLLQRKRPRPPRLTRAEQLTLAALAAALARLADGPRRRLDHCVLLFKPETILTWHRELVRRKWTYRRGSPGGRPTIPAAIEARILRLAREHPRWGHRRIQGELAKLGHAVSTSAVRAALRRHRVPPAPQRRRAPSWRDFIRRHRDVLVACDFFTVETVFLQTLYARIYVSSTCHFVPPCPRRLARSRAVRSGAKQASHSRTVSWVKTKPRSRNISARSLRLSL